MNIRFTDIFENKNIRYNTDTIGFLAITIKIADIIDIKLIIFKMSAKKPEDIPGISYSVFIIFFFKLNLSPPKIKSKIT